jgi:hypothetical protein
MIPNFFREQGMQKQGNGAMTACIAVGDVTELSLGSKITNAHKGVGMLLFLPMPPIPIIRWGPRSFTASGNFYTGCNVESALSVIRQEH